MKVIRDLIPRDTEGRRYGRLTGPALLDLLVLKLHEEASEVNEALLLGDNNKVTEELADVIEVALSVAYHLHIPLELVEDIRAAKVEERGSFINGWVIA